MLPACRRFTSSPNSKTSWHPEPRARPNAAGAHRIGPIRILREVHQALSDKRPIGYTSVLKLMQIMTAKGTLRRNEEQRAHVYEAVQPAEKTKRQLALDVLQRVFDGSASQLMMHALADRKASKEEVDELRRLLNDYERKLR